MLISSLTKHLAAAQKWHPLVETKRTAKGSLSWEMAVLCSLRREACGTPQEAEVEILLQAYEAEYSVLGFTTVSDAGPSESKVQNSTKAVKSTKRKAAADPGTTLLKKRVHFQGVDYEAFATVISKIVTGTGCALEFNSQGDLLPLSPLGGYTESPIRASVANDPKFAVGSPPADVSSVEQEPGQAMKSDGEPELQLIKPEDIEVLTANIGKWGLPESQLEEKLVQKGNQGKTSKTSNDLDGFSDLNDFIIEDTIDGDDDDGKFHPEENQGDSGEEDGGEHMDPVLEISQEEQDRPGEEEGAGEGSDVKPVVDAVIKVQPEVQQTGKGKKKAAKRMKGGGSIVEEDSNSWAEGFDSRTDKHSLTTKGAAAEQGDATYYGHDITGRSGPRKFKLKLDDKVEREPRFLSCGCEEVPAMLEVILWKEGTLHMTIVDAEGREDISGPWRAMVVHLRDRLYWCHLHLQTLGVEFNDFFTHNDDGMPKPFHQLETLEKRIAALTEERDSMQDQIAARTAAKGKGSEKKEKVLEMEKPVASSSKLSPLMS
ncbi:hypothetical protein C8J56DRAFT_888915 [Mycena floridula]|nr:hypothetical protein C8J56DRAFT_888915 [Mycena floridula]